ECSIKSVSGRLNPVRDHRYAGTGKVSLTNSSNIIGDLSSILLIGRGHAQSEKMPQGGARCMDLIAFAAFRLSFAKNSSRRQMPHIGREPSASWILLANSVSAA